jgi:uncharacterized protein YaeQ
VAVDGEPDTALLLARHPAHTQKGMSLSVCCFARFRVAEF